MLKIGDKIRQVKVMGSFNFVGKEFKITSINNGTIEFIGMFDIGYGAQGGISENEFKIYFEKVEFKECSINNKWTDWIKTKDGFSYRTDNKKYVRVRKDGYEVKSSCHPYDQFNLAKGISICLNRIKKKEESNLQNKKINYDEIIINLIKNLNEKIITVQCSVNSENTGFKHYTIDFTTVPCK